jgi:hypothetical protein
MRKILNIFCLFITTYFFSQIAEKPENFNKINFEYETKANYFVDEQGVYADTLLLKIDFPNLKHIIKINTIENVNYTGFIPLKNLKGDNLEKLISILYHTNQKIFGEYNKKSNKTVLKVIRDDENLKKIFKENFKKSYHYFNYEVIINYKKNEIDTNYPRVSYSNTIEERNKKMIYKRDTFGIFKEIIRNIEYINNVYLNSELDSKIMPEDLFSNNNFGVEKIEKIQSTTTLKSVSYSN